MKKFFKQIICKDQPFPETQKNCKVPIIFDSNNAMNSIRFQMVSTT